MATQNTVVNSGQSERGVMVAGNTFGRFVQALDQPCAIIVNNKSADNADRKHC